MGKKGKGKNRKRKQNAANPPWPTTPASTAQTTPLPAPPASANSAIGSQLATKRVDQIDEALHKPSVISVLINLFSDVVAGIGPFILTAAAAWKAWRKTRELNGWKRILANGLISVVVFSFLIAMAARSYLLTPSPPTTRKDIENAESRLSEQIDGNSREMALLASFIRSGDYRKSTTADVSPILQAFRENHNLQGLENFLISQHKLQPENQFLAKELASVEIGLGKFNQALQRLKSLSEKNPGDKEITSLISLTHAFLSKRQDGLILNTNGKGTLDERSHINYLILKAAWHGFRGERMEQLEKLRTAQTLLHPEFKVVKLKVQSDLVGCLSSLNWYDEAKTECEKGREMATKLVNELITAQFDIALASILYKQNQVEKGNQLFDSALEKIGKLIVFEGPVIMLTTTANSSDIQGYLPASTLAGFYHLRAIYAPARDRIALLERAAKLYKISNHMVLSASCLSFAGSTAYAVGQSAVALEFHEEALSEYLLTGLSNRQIASMIQIAQIHAITGNRDQASQYVRSAESICRIAELNSDDPIFLRACTDTLTLCRKFEEASTVYDRILRTSEKLPISQRIILTNNALICSVRANNRQRSSTLMHELSCFNTEALSPFLIAHILHTKSCYEVRWGSPKEANKMNDKALEIFKSLNDKEAQGFCYLTLAEICYKQNDNNNANKWLSIAKTFLSERSNLTVNEEIASLESIIARNSNKQPSTD